MEFINGHWFFGNLDFCNLGMQLSENAYHRVSLMLRSVVSFVGVLFTLIFLLTNINSVVLHIHTRILVKFHLLCTLLVALIYMAMSLFEFVRLSQAHVNPCDYLMPRLLSFSFHFLVSNVSCCQTLSCLLLTMERLICTFKYRTYEHANYKWYLIIGLSVMTVVVHYVAYLLMAKNADWDLTPFYLSFRDSHNANYVAGYIMGQFCLDVVSLIVIVTVNILNRRQRRKSMFDPSLRRHTNQLSSKLQFKESITWTNTWIPIVILHVVITGISTLVISTIHFITGGNVLMSIPITESCSFFPLYAILMPVLFYRKHSRLFWNLAENIAGRPLRTTLVSTKPQEQQFNKHFELFDKMLTKTSRNHGKK